MQKRGKTCISLCVCVCVCVCVCDCCHGQCACGINNTVKIVFNLDLEPIPLTKYDVLKCDIYDASFVYCAGPDISPDEEDHAEGATCFFPYGHSHRITDGHRHGSMYTTKS